MTKPGPDDVSGGRDGMPPGGAPPILLSDHPAIDLLNTVAAPAGEMLDWLYDGRSMLDWLAAAGRAGASAGMAGGAAGMSGASAGMSGGAATRTAKSIPAGESDEIAAEMRRLRRWWRGFVEKHAGHPLQAAAAAELGPVNALLSEDDSFRQIERLSGRTETGSAPVWQRRRRPLGTRLSLLLPVADAIGDLITGEDFSLVRRCEGTGCVLTFLDRTKSHRRRWCSMAICGNRIKAANHRARVREST